MFIEDFNAIVEGASRGDSWEWFNYHIKIVDLDIPKDAGTLFDGVNNYELFKITRDFREFQEIEFPLNKVRNLNWNLSSCPGVILPYLGHRPLHTIQIPRAVFVDDGRIFIERHMKEKEKYLESLAKSYLPFIGSRFKNKEVVLETVNKKHKDYLLSLNQRFH
ncbi:hypothetical protein J4407_03370 [Candidatus Pacearchaeota archaeon]|nr:hypothetical protein [Candidatus Pacearchaeota archaeon]